MSMDSRARLDYALFQLTPTRTRCDLVLFSGGKNEKIASGLFEPFNTHLKYVRDQIHKGGYSIKLSPPTLDAPWFTKLTFQRFVRFVSTPAILERFISLEREILQIERSFEANEVSNTNVAVPREQESGAAATGDTMESTETAKVKVEHERNLDLEPEESSKIQHQRLLGTRKMLLQKEQAMAYAGGHAAGFEMGSIDDLISFADAFGASRLREACIDFKELCKKKRTDRIWMEELAKMEACSRSELTFSGTSGIVLMDGITTNFQSDGNVVGEIVSNGSSDVKKYVTVTDQESLDSKKDDKTQSTFANVQVPTPWIHYLPQHFYNFQHPIQQLPPYEGFAFPAMKPGTSPYQMNAQWTPRENDSSLPPAHEVNYQKSSSEKKEKYQNRNGIAESGKDRQIESSESESDSDSSAQKMSSKKHPNRKKYGKKSSRTVVIRNINYITPKRRNGEKLEVSDESSLDECKFNDEDNAVGSLAKSRESNSIPNRSNDADHHNYDDGVVADSSDRGKGNESWDNFQNLLMRDEKATVHIVEKSQPLDVPDECFADKSLEDGVSIATSPAMDLEMEKIPKQQMAAGDSFVSSKRDGGSDRTTKLEDFKNGENFRSIVKRSDCPDEQFLVSQRREESINVQNDSVSACTASKSSIITRKEEDWFVVKQSNKPENQDGTFRQTVYGDDCMRLSEGCKYYNEKS
ncbi:hypothetical protein HS088_TW09G00303 [Tripterygium wilfordii]|uniref:COP1-interacting protein 7 n=1 Tax=Tripterygium wilfordii TaxID=458696 RepID=A0A7J7D7N8_TRIWF|nr:COP1-interacting protein 7-like [Tripterygium wilfordii]KAF5742259.1 hypothetical protein HS088_TW09G00303 [Tripterygium wilfordii]